MTPQSEAAERSALTEVQRVIAALPRGRWLLAVSGGRDSMVLLDAMASARHDEIAAVATFDHGTGSAARRACALVVREAESLALRVISGRAPGGSATREAEWREARLAFLHGLARETSAEIATGHTRDDQVETVVQRLLREAGPRGLAAMRASGVRPLLTVSRAHVAAYARARRVQFVEDPSNRDLRHQRNRVRHELLPALERAYPGFGEWCWALSERAAAWRAGTEQLIERLGASQPASHTLVVPAEDLRSLSPAEWQVIWPVLAARVRVVMDRRAIERASAWAPGARPGGVVQLAGGSSIECTARTFVIRGNDGAR